MAWLGTWKNRRKITSSDTNVDAILPDFPIRIHLSPSSGTGSTDLTDIFTELGADANRKKIAITTSDGVTQCYVEIELFSFANTDAELWVGVPSVAAASVTELYIYFDSAQPDNTTYVGDTGDTPAQSVWDSNFKLVMHMAQDPNGDVADAIKDSTSNANHGTPAGAMTSADLVDGKVGKAVDFDGGDDKIATTTVGILGANPRTIEAVFKVTVGAGSSAGGFVFWGTSLSGQKWNFRVDNLTGALRTECGDGNCVATNNVEDDNWHYGISLFNGTDIDEVVHYLDGSINANTSSSSLTVNTGDTYKITIGAQYATPWYHIPGIMDEVRVSNTARSAAWIKATYYSNWDELVSFGSIEEYSPEITLPSPFVATASLQSNIQVEIVPGALQAESSISISEPFWGTYVELPSPFSAEGSLQAKIGLDIVLAPLVAQSNLQSNIQVEIVPPAFASQSSMSISEVWAGIIATLPNPFSADASLQANVQIEIAPSPLIATGALLSNIGIEVSAGALNATGAILATLSDPIIIIGAPGVKRIYFFTLTGAADGVDDIIIPISSFQSRAKSVGWGSLKMYSLGTSYVVVNWVSNITYLSVVIPGFEYAADINDRLNGDLVIRMGYKKDDEILLSETAINATLENIRIYEGAINKSITLDGHGYDIIRELQEINLVDASYKNIDGGELKYRCAPNLYLRPGDTANINGDSFTVKSIVRSVSPELETYEIAE